MKIMTVEFYGDKLQVVGETLEDGVLLLKPACDAIGLDPEGQRQRLKSAPWAGACVTQATGADGKTYEMFGIPVKKVPMWLATIDASRLANEEARVKLVRYQCEAADVLARHFMSTAPAVPVMHPVEEAAKRMEVLRSIQSFLSASGALDDRFQHRLVALTSRCMDALADGIPSSDTQKLLGEHPQTVADVLTDTDKRYTLRLAILAGRYAAAKYRTRHGREPNTIKQYIDGANRPVKVYQHADRDLVDAAIREAKEEIRLNPKKSRRKP